ncbi:hypothetical protein L207DRAFT_568456 [Hyaloscypha variabilis F]|uniref:Uncharacterized protein n=1 Tax=Hyaloscypha variabilis (strain UAMH 11265 / GT02V1 / F) TaxID=1149755 RepID=A0A2J6RG60_HYAVF|nr:hypothetical protein L207DRAFT_568456 [Hyaloscypha variabilis F]
MLLGRDRPLAPFSNGILLPLLKFRCGRGRRTGTRGVPVLALFQYCTPALMARTWSRRFELSTLTCVVLKISPKDSSGRKSKDILGLAIKRAGGRGGMDERDTIHLSEAIIWERYDGFETGHRPVLDTSSPSKPRHSLVSDSECEYEQSEF